jgi:hypothetical protein
MNFDFKKIGTWAAGIAVVLLLGGGAYWFFAHDNEIKFVVPKQSIVGAEDVYAYGDIVELSISEISVPIPYLKDIQYDWKVYSKNKEKRFRLENGGKNISFAAGVEDKQYIVFASAAYLYERKGLFGNVKETAVKNALYNAVVTVGKDPGPDPDPNPPTPDPDFNVGKYGLAKTTYGLVKTAVNISSSDKMKSASALAGSFTAVAKDIESGKLTDLVQILNRTFEDNNRALNAVGTDPMKWDSFFEHLKGVLLALYKDKKMNTAKDFSTAWLEIAEGFNKVK